MFFCALDVYCIYMLYVFMGRADWNKDDDNDNDGYVKWNSKLHNLPTLIHIQLTTVRPHHIKYR